MNLYNSVFAMKAKIPNVGMINCITILLAGSLSSRAQSGAYIMGAIKINGRIFMRRAGIKKLIVFKNKAP
ncbi:hypothetical protein FACS189481_0190 [Clostridia bacterium]|nr:hypothetical protein FACS189481_0190 [Clostridia bacterium]